MTSKQEKQEAEQQEITQAEASEIPSLRGIELPWETWHVYYMNGKRVGYTHVSSAIDTESGSDAVLTQVEDFLTMKRGTSTFVQSLQQTSRESRDGNLSTFDAELRVGPLRTQFAGRVMGNVLNITTTRGNNVSSQSVTWSNLHHGFVGIQQSLLAKPMRVGETRRIKLLIPVVNQQGIAELSAVGTASITSADGKSAQAVEIEVTTKIGNGSSLASMIWIDEQGQLLKSHTPSLNLVAVGATKELALQSLPSSVDLLSLTALTVKGTLRTPAEAYRVGYTLRPKSLEGKAEEYQIEPQIGQWTRKRDDGLIQLLVSCDPNEVDRDGFTSLKLQPEPGDTASGPIIDSGSIDVRKLAALSKAESPRDTALALTRTVKQLIGPGDFSRGFATASQTAKDGVGDCTERAVLLAAMLRAKNIPARVAAGLVYQQAAEPQMAYHMWTLAWVDERWLALDPTAGGLAPADRIILATSHLADGNEYSCLQPVLAALGRIDIEIVNAVYKPLK